METLEFDPRSLIGRETDWVDVYADEKSLQRYLAATGEAAPVGGIEADPNSGQSAPAAEISADPCRWDEPVLPPGFLSAIRPDASELNLPAFGKVKLNVGNEFEWLVPVFVGEHLRRKTRIANVYDKVGKNGTSWFIVMESEYRRADGQLVAIAKTNLMRR